MRPLSRESIFRSRNQIYASDFVTFPSFSGTSAVLPEGAVVGSTGEGEVEESASVPFPAPAVLTAWRLRVYDRIGRTSGNVRPLCMFNKTSNIPKRSPKKLHAQYTILMKRSAF
jgi:hypothetical protein